MTGATPPINDEDLHSFVDGEIEPRRREAVLRFLDGSPTDVQRVETWRRQKEALRGAFARVESEPAPASILLPPQEIKSRFNCKLLSGHERLAAKAKPEADAAPAWMKRCKDAVILLAGFAAGVVATIAALVVADRSDLWRRPPLEEANPIAAPAESDAIFIGRTISALQGFAPSPPSAPAAAAPDKSLGRRGRANLVVPNLQSIGLQLAGVRIAPSEFDRMYCLFYTTPTNVALALCSEKVEDDGASGFHQVGRFPAGTIDWRQTGGRYALTGPLPDSELRNLAARIRAEIEAFDGR